MTREASSIRLSSLLVSRPKLVTLFSLDTDQFESMRLVVVAVFFGFEDLALAFVLVESFAALGSSSSLFGIIVVVIGIVVKLDASGAFGLINVGETVVAVVVVIVVVEEGVFKEDLRAVWVAKSRTILFDVCVADVTTVFLANSNSFVVCVDLLHEIVFWTGVIVWVKLSNNFFDLKSPSFLLSSLEFDFK